MADVPASFDYKRRSNILLDMAEKLLVDPEVAGDPLDGSASPELIQIAVRLVLAAQRDLIRADPGPLKQTPPVVGIMLCDLVIPKHKL